MVEETFTKDPNAVLDYSFDWATEWLAAGETISSHDITIGTGLIKDSDNENSGIVTVWLSGGTVGVNYPVACKIVTSAGRTDERTILIECMER